MDERQAQVVDARQIAGSQKIKQSRYARLQRGLLRIPGGVRFEEEVIIAQWYVKRNFLTPENDRAAAK